MIFKKKKPEDQVEDYIEKKKQRDLKLETLKQKRMSLEADKLFRDKVRKEEDAIKQLNSQGGDKVKAFGSKFREGAKKVSKFVATEGRAAGRTLSEVTSVAGSGKVKARWPSPLQTGFSNFGNMSASSYFEDRKKSKSTGGLFNFSSPEPLNENYKSNKPKKATKKKKKKRILVRGYYK